ncbi:MAG: hypothetical protein PWQ12_129 [Clostridiales bacterium]|jgi:uncharacterized protein YaaQ|nr:hypothetical protein [Clostridiales bacterium]
MMKLIIAIVHDEDAGALVKQLTESEFGVTKLASTGGFLKSGNTTLLIGTPKERVDAALAIIEETSKTRKEITTTTSLMGDNSVMGMPLEISVGGATVFVVDVENYLKL